MKTRLLADNEKTENEAPTREEMIGLLNEDLAREYQAIIAYTVYSQTMKGAPYTDIARELEAHAAPIGDRVVLLDDDRDEFRRLRRHRRRGHGHLSLHAPR